MPKNGNSADDNWTEPTCAECQQLLLQIHIDFERNNPPLSPKALALFRAKTHPSVRLYAQPDQNSQPAKK